MASDSRASPAAPTSLPLRGDRGRGPGEARARRAGRRGGGRGGVSPPNRPRRRAAVVVRATATRRGRGRQKERVRGHRRRPFRLRLRRRRRDRRYLLGGRTPLLRSTRRREPSGPWGPAGAGRRVRYLGISFLLFCRAAGGGRVKGEGNRVTTASTNAVARETRTYPARGPCRRAVRDEGAADPLRRIKWRVGHVSPGLSPPPGLTSSQPRWRVAGVGSSDVRLTSRRGPPTRPGRLGLDRSSYRPGGSDASPSPRPSSLVVLPVILVPVAPGVPPPGHGGGVVLPPPTTSARLGLVPAL